MGARPATVFLAPKRKDRGASGGVCRLLFGAGRQKLLGVKAFFVVMISAAAALFIGAIVVGFFLPKTFVVEREIAIAAPRERVFALIGDLENWPEWGPWKDADASLEVTLGEKTSGVGASQRWVAKDGDGRLVFTAADPERGIEFDLFFNQDAFVNTSSILYEESDGELLVTWTMTGSVPVPVMGGYLAKMMPGMVGPMFDQGLEKLKAAAEREGEWEG